MLKPLKLSVLHLARRLSIFSLVRRSGWRRQRLLILCYHGISFSDEHLWSPSLYLSQETFHQRMRLLHDQNYRVLPLQEALTRLYDGTLPESSVAITFDDGEYNFHVLAYPVLRTFGFPATVYLATYYCSHQLPVFDVAAAYLIWKGRGKMLDTRSLLPDGNKILLSDRNHRQAYRHVRSSVLEHQISAMEKDKIAEEIARQVGCNYQHIRNTRMFHLMNERETAEIASQGISVELHTHRHRTPRDKDLFLREIQENRQAISSIVGTTPRHFCYPSGDYTPDYFPWLEGAGVLSATTCEIGLAARGGNRFQIPRMLDMDSLQSVEIEAWLSGFAAALPRRS